MLLPSDPGEIGRRGRFSNPVLGASAGRSPSAVPTLRDHLSFSTPRFAPALCLRVREAEPPAQGRAVAFSDSESSGDLISGYQLQKESSPRNMDKAPAEV